MTALRFQTGGKHQTSQASLQAATVVVITNLIPSHTTTPPFGVITLSQPGTNRFRIRTVLLLDWLSTKADELSLPNHLGDAKKKSSPPPLFFFLHPAHGVT